jgi:hypothetical protein
VGFALEKVRHGSIHDGIGEPSRLRDAARLAYP